METVNKQLEQHYKNWLQSINVSEGMLLQLTSFQNYINELNANYSTEIKQYCCIKLNEYGVIN